MRIVKEKCPTMVPFHTLCHGASFLWEGRLYIKIPTPNPITNNVVSVSSGYITDMPINTLVTPVVVNEVHVREL